MGIVKKPAKKEEFIVKRTETLDLNFYTVRSQDGRWLRAKKHGYNSLDHGRSWTDDLTEAKIYSKPGPAKSQITFWANNYPTFGVPDLVQITTGVCLFLDQENRVKDAIKKKEIASAKRKVETITYRINNCIARNNIERDKVRTWKKELESAKTTLQNLSSK